MEKWNGKTAIVTGASSGIGEAIVRDLVKHGINVVALARRMVRLTTLKEQLKNEQGKLIPIKCDVSDKASIDATFEEIEKKVGAVHILVNNAGIALEAGFFDGKEAADEIITNTVNTNLLGLVRVSRAAYNLIKKSEDYGIIINISSVAGHYVPNVYGALPNVYAGTKHAVRAVTESMRQELNAKKESKIRVCEISPGVVDTEIGGWKDKPEFQELIKSMNLPRLEASNVAQTVRFMLMTPYEVNITEIIVRPVGENF